VQIPCVNPDKPQCLGDSRVWNGIFGAHVRRDFQPSSRPGHQTASERPPAPATPVRAICPHSIRLPSPAQTASRQRRPLLLSEPPFPYRMQLPLSPLFLPSTLPRLLFPLDSLYSVALVFPPCVRAPLLVRRERPLPSPLWSRRRYPTSRHRPCQQRWRQGCTLWARRLPLPRRRNHRRLRQRPRLVRPRRGTASRHCRR